MENRKPLLNYILINVAISALTTLLVLIVWNRVTALPEPEPLPAPSESSDAIPKPENPPNSSFSDQLQIITIIGAGDVDNERVLIEHVGTQDVLLAGWTLRDDDGHRYKFPAIVLHSGASLEVFSRQGEDSVTRLFWNESDPIWEISEMAILVDPVGETQASYQIP